MEGYTQAAISRNGILRSETANQLFLAMGTAAVHCFEALRQVVTKRHTAHSGNYEHSIGIVLDSIMRWPQKTYNEEVESIRTTNPRLDGLYIATVREFIKDTLPQPERGYSYSLQIPPFHEFLRIFYECLIYPNGADVGPSSFLTNLGYFQSDRYGDRELYHQTAFSRALGRLVNTIDIESVPETPVRSGPRRSVISRSRAPPREYGKMADDVEDVEEDLEEDMEEDAATFYRRQKRTSARGAVAAARTPAQATVSSLTFNNLNRARRSSAELALPKSLKQTISENEKNNTVSVPAAPRAAPLATTIATAAVTPTPPRLHPRHHHKPANANSFWHADGGDTDSSDDASDATDESFDDTDTHTESVVQKTWPNVHTGTPAKSHAPTPTPVKSHAPTPTPVKSHAPTPTPVKSHAPTPTPAKSHAPTPTPAKSHAPTPTPVNRPSAKTKAANFDRDVASASAPTVPSIPSGVGEKKARPNGGTRVMQLSSKKITPYTNTYADDDGDDDDGDDDGDVASMHSKISKTSKASHVSNASKVSKVSKVSQVSKVSKVSKVSQGSTMSKRSKAVLPPVLPSAHLPKNHTVTRANASTTSRDDDGDSLCLYKATSKATPKTNISKKTISTPRNGSVKATPKQATAASSKVTAAPSAVTE